MKKQIASLKVECKELAASIKESKRAGYRPWETSVKFRYTHIAYCLLRGRTMEQIENYHRDPNDGTHRYVARKAEEIIKKLTKEFEDEQALCANPVGPS